jgi:CHAT domain-containing protein/tetratricopeptide (TPR) repeat protein
VDNRQKTIQETASDEEKPRGIPLEVSRLGGTGDVSLNIQFLQKALSLIRRDQDPRGWAGIQGNLGNLYFDRQEGDRADNIERAIEAFEALNSVYTRDRDGDQWGFAQYDLAKAYYARLHGERADNIERAIEAWENAVTVFTAERTYREWATTQNNLARAYTLRARGSPEENLATATRLLNQVISNRLQQNLPNLWAVALENLGDAHEARAKLGHTDSIERAIQAWRSALLVYSPERSPEDWTRIQNKLASAFYGLASGEPAGKGHAEYWEQASQAYTAALKASSRESDPKRWVEMQYNLASTLLQALERGENAPAIPLDARRVSEMFLDIADCCGRWDAPDPPDDWYAGLSMLGSVRALLTLPEADRKPELIWARLDSASKLLWLAQTNMQPAPITSRTAVLTGLINSARLMVEQARNHDQREIGFGWLRRASDSAQSLGDQRLLALARYELAWQSEQHQQGDEMAVRRHLISLYEKALTTARADPKLYLACLRHLIHNREVLFSRTHAERRANTVRLLQLIADADIAIPRENPELRCGYLQERVTAYDYILNAIEPYSGEPVIISAQEFQDDPALPTLPVTPQDIREDIVRSLDQAIELSRLLGQTREEWVLLWRQVRYLHHYGWLEAAKQALVRADGLGVHPLPLVEEPDLLSIRASVAELDGRFDEALALYKQASDALLNVPLSRIRLGAKLSLANRAQLLIMLERWEEAFLDLEQAISVEEAYLAEYHDKYHPIQDDYTVINLQGHLGWLSEFTQPIYADMARVCAHLNRPEDSFQFSEKARGSFTRRQLQVVPDRTNILNLTGQPSRTALLQYLIHDNESLCYVINAGHVELFSLPSRWSEEVARLRRGLVMLDGQPVSLRQLADAYAEHPGDQCRLRRWCRGLDEAGKLMYDMLVAPVAPYLEKHGIGRLIISSHSGLEQLPWYAAYHDSSDVRRYLADDFVLSKIASATVLQHVSAYDRLDCGSVAFAWDRHSGLQFVGVEEQMIRKAVADSGGDVVVRSFEDADSFYNFLAGSTRIHIASHGVFDDDDPFLTSLVLDTESRTCVRLADLLSGGVRLLRGCSVVLSSCETGLVAPDQGGEHVSLSTGFLLAGARQIVAPLWAVNDVATSLLMGRFYAEWAARPTDAPVALREAQCWLRRQSREELASTVEEVLHSSPVGVALRLRLFQLQKHFRTHECEIPYAHPHWWAGFEFIGSC